MSKQRGGARPGGRGPATFALGLILAAGAATWFFYPESSRSEHPPAAPGAAVTIAAQDSSASLAPAENSGLPTRVRIASAGIDTAVEEVGVVRRDGRAVWETAWRAAGHHVDSSLPGNPGNVVLTGHVSVASHANKPVFANLEAVRVGDIVEVYSGDRVHRYKVTEMREVEPDALDVLGGDHRSLLTLITCTTDLERRLVVVGALVS